MEESDRKKAKNCGGEDDFSKREKQQQHQEAGIKLKTTPSHVFGQKELNPGKWEKDEIESRQTRRAKVQQKDTKAHTYIYPNSEAIGHTFVDETN